MIDLHDVAKEISKRHGKGLRIGVAVDGSNISDKAMGTAGS